MPPRLVNKLRKKAELMLAAKETPGARTAARENGIAIGKRVRYGLKDLGGERFGVVRSLHLRSVVVELSADGMMRGGEDIIIREDEVPYSGILEVLGDGRLAQPKPTVDKPKTSMAPPREGGYLHCDFDDSSIFEVLRVKGRGLVTLCRDHAQGPTEDEPAPFKFKLGLIYETYRAWPKPTEQELSVASSRGSAGTRSSGRSSRSSAGRTRRRRTSRTRRGSA